MAKIVNRDQPIRTKVLSPQPSYSRVVGIHIRVAAGIGVYSYCYTAMLGNNIRLLQIKALLSGGLPIAPLGGFISIATGNSVPQSGNEIATQWELIIPTQCGGKPSIYWWGERDFLSWEMNILYTGKERRFAVAIENGEPLEWRATVWFQISEG